MSGVVRRHCNVHQVAVSIVARLDSEKLTLTHAAMRVWRERCLRHLGKYDEGGRINWRERERI